MALLLPDPYDKQCPQSFRDQARSTLGTCDILSERQRNSIATDEGLRDTILEFIGDFADWRRATDPSYLKVGRHLVRAAHESTPPLVVDPFSGGGSIPLEALRLGCEAFASDLNPVSCLILKTMLESIPQGNDALAQELREVGDKTTKAFQAELADLYPKDPDGATPTMFLWSRTVRCEAPNCGAEIPLMRSFWLRKKKTRKFALRPVEIKPASPQEPPQVDLEVFTPETEKDVRSTGTVSDAKATCLCCGTVLPPDRVREQLAAQNGGADVIFDSQGRRIGGARLRAVQTTMPGRDPKCLYRSPTEQDYQSVRNAQQRIAAIVARWEQNGRKGLCPVPDEPLPPIGTLGFRVQRYGMLQWGHLFTARQKLALVTVGQVARTAPPRPEVAVAQTLAISRCTAFWTSLGRWRHESESVAAIFGIQALPMIWDFCEPLPFSSGAGSSGAGSFEAMIRQIARTIDLWPKTSVSRPQIADAAESPLPDESADVWFTDPPYYDAIPYSDLSDFFLVWLKRNLPGHPLLQDPFDPGNPLSPKTREAVQDETKKLNDGVKDRKFFESKMETVFKEGRRSLKEGGIGSVIFAHKETESWEALLSGMVRSGWTISGSWPIATERPGRLRSHNSAALATSIHLVCRPRSDDATIGDWPDVLRKLSERVKAWMSRLQDEGIRGADLVFSCIGPALEIFSTHRKVETVDGRNVDLPAYLEKLWEVVGRAALSQVLDVRGGGGVLRKTLA